MAAKAALQPVEGGNAISLAKINIGSDELTEDLRRNRSGVVISRYGIPLAMRVYKNRRVWNVKLNAATTNQIKEFRRAYDARKNKLYPDSSDTGTYYIVLWEGNFSPIYVAPDMYSLQFSLKEMPYGDDTDQHEDAEDKIDIIPEEGFGIA